MMTLLVFMFASLCQIFGCLTTHDNDCRKNKDLIPNAKPHLIAISNIVGSNAKVLIYKYKRSKSFFVLIRIGYFSCILKTIALISKQGSPRGSRAYRRKKFCHSFHSPIPEKWCSSKSSTYSWHS